MRKGITPIIAIVLLLVITVGAVSVVYTQFETLTDTSPGEKLAEQRKIQNTELTFSSVYENEDSPDAAINISVRNTGDVALNASKELEISFIPDGSGSSIDYNVYSSKYSDETTGNLDCFNSSATNKVVDPGETFTCDTGVEFPDATESVGIVISFKEADKSWEHTCSPSTSGSITC